VAIHLLKNVFTHPEDVIPTSQSFVNMQQFKSESLKHHTS